MAATKISYIALLCLLTGCASDLKQGDYQHHVCKVIKSHWGWSHSLKAVERKTGLPPSLALSVIYHESAFQSDARPPRGRLFGFIPWRSSTAYGYGQIKDETWEWYKEKKNQKPMHDPYEPDLFL